MPTDTIARALAARIPTLPPSSTATNDLVSAQLPTNVFDPAVASNAAGETYICGGDTTISSSGQSQAYKLSADGATLTQLPNMPGPKVSARAAVDNNGRLYVMGGNNAGATNAAVYVYDPGTNAWTTLAAPMPAARAQFGAVSDAQGRIYVIGGGASDSVFNTVYRYDPSTGTWSTLTAMPVGRQSFGAAFAGGFIYVSGGSDGGGTSYSTFYRYDVAAGTWSTLTNSAVIRITHGSSADSQGRIFIAGGQDASGNLRGTIERYDPVSSTWSTLSIALNTARAWVSAGRDSQGRMILPGGASGTSSARTYPRTIERIAPESADLVSSGWTTKAALAAARYGAACSTDGNFVYVSHGYASGAVSDTLQVLRLDTFEVSGGTAGSATAGSVPRHGAAGVFFKGQHWAIGGLASDNTASNRVSYFTPTPSAYNSQGTWSHDASLPRGVAYASAAVVGNAVYVAGGQAGASGSTSLNTLFRYDGSTGTWTNLTSTAQLPAPRSQGSFVAVGTKLYYIGGVDGSNTTSASVFCYDTITGTWSTLTSAPVGINAYPAAAVGTTIAVTGGTGLTTQALLLFDTTAGTWSQVAVAPPTAHSINGSAVAVGSTVYFISGQNTANIDAVTPGTAGTTPFGRRIKLLQQYLAGTDVAAFSIAKRLPMTAPAPATWKTLGSLPASRTGAATTTDGTNIIVTHGYTNAVQNSGFTITPAGVVTALTNASSGVARQGVASAFCNGRHYVIAGLNSGNGLVGTVDAYTPAGSTGATGTWQAMTAMPINRYNAAAAAVGNFIYVAGGQVNTSYSSARTDLYRYNTTNDTWTDLSGTAQMPANRTQGAMVAIGTKLYYIGGYNNSGTAQTAVLVFDTTTSTWSTLGLNSGNAGYQAATVLGSTIYAYLTSNALVAAWDTAANPSSPTFNTVAGVPEHGNYPGLVTVGNTVNVVGGASSANIDTIDPVSGPSYVANVRRLRAVLAA